MVHQRTFFTRGWSGEEILSDSGVLAFELVHEVMFKILVQKTKQFLNIIQRAKLSFV